MEQKILDYKIHFTDKQFLISFILSLLYLSISIIINFYAGTYATQSASNSVTDIILSNIRTYDVDGFFVYGSVVFGLLVLFICLNKPKRIPFTLKSIALFIIIRSFFITLTHIGPFPSQISITSSILSGLSFGADLFFSGHTGMPFLLSLIFWKDKWLRYIFLSFSIMFAIIVLLAHLHYSIDVLSAYFITFTIYNISLKMFKKDNLLFEQDYK